jgi:putative ABC transport system permease protein
VLVNQAAVSRFGWEDPLGRRLYGPNGGLQGRVVGVVENVHYASLRRPVEPTVYTTEWVRDRRLVVKASGAANHLRETWGRFFPDRPLQAYSLGARYERQYQSSRRLGRVIGLFAVIAVALAGLGLFTLAAHEAERRTREIGIRKAVGASVSDIVRLLSGEFALLVGAGFSVAAPVAALVMQEWLAGFAYHVDLEPALFLAAGFAAGAVALTGAVARAVQAAQRSPAAALQDSR